MFSNSRTGSNDESIILMHTFPSQCKFAVISYYKDVCAAVRFLQNLSDLRIKKGIVIINNIVQSLYVTSRKFTVAAFILNYVITLTVTKELMRHRICSTEIHREKI